MRVLRVVTGVLVFFGAFLVASVTWLTALTWWASADVAKGLRRYWR